MSSVVGVLAVPPAPAGMAFAPPAPAVLPALLAPLAPPVVLPPPPAAAALEPAAAIGCVVGVLLEPALLVDVGVLGPLLLFVMPPLAAGMLAAVGGGGGVWPCIGLGDELDEHAHKELASVRKQLKIVRIGEWVIALAVPFA